MRRAVKLRGAATLRSPVERFHSKRRRFETHLVRELRQQFPLVREPLRELDYHHIRDDPRDRIERYSSDTAPRQCRLFFFLREPETEPLVDMRRPFARVERVRHGKVRAHPTLKHALHFRIPPGALLEQDMLAYIHVVNANEYDAFQLPELLHVAMYFLDSYAVTERVDDCRTRIHFPLTHMFTSIDRWSDIGEFDTAVINDPEVPHPKLRKTKADMAAASPDTGDSDWGRVEL